MSYHSWESAHPDKMEKMQSIGNGAFSCCDSLSSIEIPDSITSIGNGAFFGCDALDLDCIPKNLYGEALFWYR